MTRAAPLPTDLVANSAQAQLQQIVDHTSAAMFVKDLDGRFLFVNREFERIKGMPVAAIIGRLDGDLFPAAMEELHRNDAQVVDERRAIDFEEIVETAHGTRTYLAHKFPLFDETGRAYAVCGVATDITERKRSEEALRAAALAVTSAEGEGVFRELVRYLSKILDVDVAMIAVHVAGDRTRMRTLAACLDGKPLANFEYPLGGSPCRHVVGREFRFVGAGVRPEFPPGTLFEAKGMDSYAALPLNDSDGLPLGLIATMDRRPMRDAALAESMLKIFAMRAVAEIERTRADAALRASEAQLRQAQKMEAIGHLTGGIAHDFNNLLTSIMGFVVLAAERSAEGRDDKLASYLEKAHLACLRARDLIQQMLTFSRSRRGEPRTLALAPLIRESVKLLRSSLPASIALGTDLDEDAPPVLIDPVQLEQVLMNLAINARDAMRSSGEIGVAMRFVGRAAEVCTSCRKDVGGDMVELSVSDNGPGITADVQERMFEPFFTTKDIGQGSGMGLSTVHGIVHEHGGHIVVESRPGVGARFRVLLPALRSQDRGGVQPRFTARGAALPRAALAGRVAVIDDEITVATFMNDLLAHWGLEVTTFADARAALDAIAGGAAFNLVITDQTMPGMTGMEFARAARAMPVAPPIVLYTGYDEGLTPAAVERAGVAALVRKPIEPSLLLAVLEKHLQRPIAAH